MTHELVPTGSGSPLGAETRIWDRQPGESARWYARFRAYLYLGLPRTMLAAYRQITGSAKSNVDPRWYTVAARWRWDIRAAAYDEHTYAALQERETARRFDLRETRLSMNRQLSALLHQLILDYLTTVDAGRLDRNFGHIRSLFRDLLEMQRSEMGLVNPQTEATLTADDMIKMRDSFYAFLARPPTYSFPAPKEVDPEMLAASAEILCDLYPTAADAERLAQAAGLQRRNLDLTGSPIHIWRSVVTAAHANNSLIALISNSLRDYPGQPKLIDLLRANL